MVNLNGEISKSTSIDPVRNRAFLYNDMVVETLRIHKGAILFWEAHYFKLMASMRIMRMKIPMNFTMEFFEDQILKTTSANENKNLGVTIYIFREGLGKDEIQDMPVSFLISVMEIADNFGRSGDALSLTLFKDHRINTGLLSSMEITSRPVRILAEIFAKENDFEDALILNTAGNIVGSCFGNIFLVKDRSISTPQLSDGALNTVYRNKLITLIIAMDDVSIEEKSISAFDVSDADEVMVLNTFKGLISVEGFRKSKFKSGFAEIIRKEFWNLAIS